KIFSFLFINMRTNTIDKPSTRGKSRVETTKQVEKLQATVNDLKLVVAKLLTKQTTSKNNLQVGSTSATLVKSDPIQAQARKQVRQLVQDYASDRANDLGITGDSRSIFFDLSFKALYDA